MYHQGSFLSTSNYYVKTIEKILSIDMTQKIIQLLRLKNLKEVQSESKYNYL